MKAQRLLTLALALTLTPALWAQEMPEPVDAPPPPGEGAARGGMRQRQGGGPGGGDLGMPQEAMMGRFITSPKAVEALGLTEEQVKTIRDAMGGVRDEIDDIRQQLEAAAMEQGKLLLADPLDEAALMNAIEKTGQIRTELAKRHIQPILIIKKTLTPEQAKKAREMMEEHRDRRQGWRDQRRGEGGPEQGDGDAPQGDEPGNRGRGRGRDMRPPKAPACPHCGKTPAPEPPAPAAEPAEAPQP